MTSYRVIEIDLIPMEYLQPFKHERTGIEVVVADAGRERHFVSEVGYVSHTEAYENMALLREQDDFTPGAGWVDCGCPDDHDDEQDEAEIDAERAALARAEAMLDDPNWVGSRHHY